MKKGRQASCPSGDRTHRLPVNSRLLHQASYRATKWGRLGLNQRPPGFDARRSSLLSYSPMSAATCARRARPLQAGTAGFEPASSRLTAERTTSLAVCATCQCGFRAGDLTRTRPSVWGCSPTSSSEGPRGWVRASVLRRKGRRSSVSYSGIRNAGCQGTERNRFLFGGVPGSRTPRALRATGLQPVPPP